MINYFIFTAAAALPAPIELFSAAVFKIGEVVHSIPDTAPGVHPAHSVAITGAIIELKVEGGWRYNISSIHDPRNTLWVPEHRVRLISKSIFDDAYIEPRAGLQRQLTDARETSKKWKRRFWEVNAECPVLAGELSRLKKAKRVLEVKVDTLVKSNAGLAQELRGSMSSAIFNRKPPSSGEERKPYSRGSGIYDLTSQKRNCIVRRKNK